MGQTLTHGIYLPDEGERNCYAGLAANWQLLDGAVGTVAEHTTQIAGKAPLVHTHTKADITDFPAYGNTAGTICEGNDSRLSDARTPVAHTHGKADITDLFNSANTWTAQNTFQGGGIQIKDTSAVSASGYGAAVYFWDYQGNRYGYIQPYVTSDNYKNIIIGADGTGRIQLNSHLVPYAANAVNLGTSDLQWNNLYAKNYYYNGVAWGLDKDNTWSGANTFTGSARPIRLRGSNNDIYNVQPQSAIYSQIDFVDKNNETMSYILFQHRTDATETHRLCLRQKRITLDAYYSVDLNNLGDFYPEQNNAINLGTSTNKWKTLNGINPGALSLPDISSGDPIDTTNWSTAGLVSTYTPSINGWMYIRVTGDSSSYIVVRYGNENASSPTSSFQSPSINHISIFIPVLGGVPHYLYINGALRQALLFPCQGNV